MNRLFKLLAIVLVAFLAGYFLEAAIDASENIPGSVEGTLEVISELFSVFVAFSIFAITWQSYTKSRDNHSLFLGTTFFIAGFLILFHLLSYPFMPEFFTPNSSHKAAIFLIESRIILAVLLLASVYIHKDTLPGLINKRFLFSFVIVISAIFLVTALLYQDSQFAAYDLGNYSTETIFLLSMITAALFYASYRYFKEFKETGQKNLIFLIEGLIIIIFSNLVYFSYEFSGHFLIITGFYFIYLALYKSSVELPYEKLALAEEKLRMAAEDKYRLLFDNANDAIITTDLEDRVTSWNRSAENIFGWASTEVIGKKLSGLIVPSQMQGEKEEEIICETGKPACGVETMRLRKDGNKINISFTTSPLMDPNKNITGISFILRDITERRQAEEERRKVEEIRLENERLVLAGKAKSEFLAIMSHELRTPLNAILGFSELMGNMKGELNEKQKRYMENILTAGKNLLSLVDSILDLNSVEAGKMEKFVEKMPVHETINDILSPLKEKAAKQNIILKNDYDPQLDTIETDTHKFKHILSNLLSNAIKFSKPDGGTVTIRTKKEGDMAKFSVSDTGIGIMEKDMERLFRTFEQLDTGTTRKYGGTGLGLAVSKKLVELLGGSISVESRYGEGSTFTFTLPVGAQAKVGMRAGEFLASG
ncbi:MAG: MASE3 domain-containing protein [Candidatus Methanoperedens sp.]|nr:MASE3 domain-containing protein [Candidatus Methanoperedens sp.]